MRAICVDDERISLEEALSACGALAQVDEVRGFDSARGALAWLREHGADVALLDIHMPEMDGLQLAAEIQRLRPGMEILFLTAHPEHALDAFALHAAGYLLKPVDRERLSAEFDCVLSRRAGRLGGRVRVHTFGNFDVFVDGEPVRFALAKSKELLAYLVDRQGCCVTRSEAFSVLWEERQYDRRMQKQLDVYIRKLRESLQAYGIGELFEMKRGTLRVRPETFVCDAYLFFRGDGESIRQYRGEYMNEYSWASPMESRITLDWEREETAERLVHN